MRDGPAARYWIPVSHQARSREPECAVCHVQAAVILNHAMCSNMSPAFRISIPSPCYSTLGDTLQRGGIIGQQEADHYLLKPDFL